MKLIAIAFGGALGALLRYAIALLTLNLWPLGRFPLGTLLANLLGAFLIGVLWQRFTLIDISSNARAFIFTGFLGAFTTFSTFALEGVNLYQAGAIQTAVFYILITNVVGIGLIFLGFAAAAYLG